MRTTWTRYKLSLFKINLSPSNPVVKAALPPTWQEFIPFFITQLKCLGKNFTSFGKRMHSAIYSKLKHWKHIGLKIWY